MMGNTDSHYKILKKILPKNGGQVGEGGMSSMIKKYNKLIALTGGVVCKRETLKKEATSGQLSVTPQDINRIFLYIISKGPAYESHGCG